MRRAAALAAAAVALAGCGEHAQRPTGRERLSATPRSALVDQPVLVAVGGLRARQRAALSATWRSHDGTVWASSRPVRADARGRAVVPLAPWLWTMTPRGGRSRWFFPDRRRASVVRLALAEGGAVVARSVVRESEAPRSVRERTLSVRREGLYGIYVRPRHASRRPAVLMLGGSGGGVGPDIADLFAAHGYPSLALGYYNGPGVPRRLKRIPLEYFARGLRWLRRQPGVDPRRVAVYGVSRGGEAALLIGATFPRLAHGVIAMVPNYQVWHAEGRGAPWTYRGKSIEPSTLIRVERINGPVLVAGAGEDRRWDSSFSTDQIEQRLEAYRFRFGHRRLEFPHAGHDVGTAIPFLPPGTDRAHWGGSRAATGAGKVAVWRAVLDYLRSMSSMR